MAPHRGSPKACQLLYAFTKFILIGISSSLHATFECTPCSLLLHSSPLLEEKGDFGSQALISNIHDPFPHLRQDGVD
jgi:hypothetical protein